MFRVAAAVSVASFFVISLSLLIFFISLIISTMVFTIEFVNSS